MRRSVGWPPVCRWAACEVATRGPCPFRAPMPTPASRDKAACPAANPIIGHPGKQPYRGSQGLAWVLEKDTDLVLQLHMQPSGKPEAIQPSVAFYFTDQAPTNTA